MINFSTNIYTKRDKDETVVNTTTYPIEFCSSASYTSFASSSVYYSISSASIWSYFNSYFFNYTLTGNLYFISLTSNFTTIKPEFFNMQIGDTYFKDYKIWNDQSTYLNFGYIYYDSNTALTAGKIFYDYGTILFNNINLSALTASTTANILYTGIDYKHYLAGTIPIYSELMSSQKLLYNSNTSITGAHIFYNGIHIVDDENNIIATFSTSATEANTEITKNYNFKLSW